MADHAGTVSVIDLSDNTEVARIAIDGDPFGVSATADRVYVTDYAGGTVAVLDQATNAAFGTRQVASVNPVGAPGYPYFAAVVGSRLYVVNSATNALTVIDGSVNTVVDVDPGTRAVDSIPGGAAPVDIIVRGDRLYVSNVNCATVIVIDVATQPARRDHRGRHPAGPDDGHPRRQDDLRRRRHGRHRAGHHQRASRGLRIRRVSAGPPRRRPLTR